MSKYSRIRSVSGRPIVQVMIAVCCLGALGCQRSITPGDDPVELATVLPTQTAYITGVISQRDSVDRTNPRVLVERTAGEAASGALVTLPSDLPVYWRNGRRGTVRDLQVGRIVTAWVGPTELRSSPPQVSAVIVVVEK